MNEAFNFGPEKLITQYSNTGRIINNLFSLHKDSLNTLQEKDIIISTEDIVLILKDFEKFLKSNPNPNTNNDYTFTNKLNSFLSLFSDKYNLLNNGNINYIGQNGNILFILKEMLSGYIALNNKDISIKAIDEMTIANVTSAIKHFQINQNNNN